MRAVDLLAQLQEVDTTLDQQRLRLAQLQAQLEDRSELEAVVAEHRAAESLAHRLDGEQQDLELEVQDLRGKLAALEKKLYSGTVGNPKELDAMLRDAQQFRALISAREDRLLALYDEVEAAASALERTTARLRATEAAFAERQRALADERDAVAERVRQAEQRRQDLRAAAPPDALRIYDNLRRTRGGLAVAEVVQRICQGCRVSLPGHEVSRARASDDLVFCQSCGRILHVTR